MEPLISIIVPVYNVEMFLNECLESIVTQSYRNLEILLIDDGSTDTSSKICDKYARKDKRIQVVHQRNKGLSHARNVGIELATGDFLSFIDSDDTICNDFIETLYTACFHTGVSLSMCAFYRNSRKISIKEDDCKIYSSYEVSKALLTDTIGFYGITCNKLYKRELFDDMRFPEGKIHEDEFVIYKILWECKKCAITDKQLYFYRKRRESISDQIFSQKSMDKALAYREKIRFYSKNHSPELVALAKASYCYFLRRNIHNIYKLNAPETSTRYWWKELIESYFYVLKSKNATWKKKTCLTLFMLFPRGYQKIKDAYIWIRYH